MENLEHGLRKTRLRWVGLVKCRDENGILRRGRRPVDRPKKTIKHEEVNYRGRYGRG